MKPAFAATLLVALAGALGACVSVPEDPNQLQRSKPNLEEASRLNTDLGVDYARKGNFDMALVKLQRALDQNSGYAPAHIAIAFVYSQLGKTDDADTHYRKALSLTDDGSVRNNYGVFLCEQKRYDDAEKMFLAAVADRRYQAPEAAWTNAGQCERRVPNLDKAETYFREALKVRPQFADALSQMAWICYQKGDYLRARAFLQRYEKVGPPTPETLLIGAQTETALGDAAAAAAYNTRLREQFPESDESARSSSSPSS